MTEHVVVLNVAGLSPHHFERPELIPHLAKFAQRGLVRPMRPTFPAVTCSMQATLLTGKPPSEHGIIANGYYDRDAHEVKFWEQPDKLVQATRLWDQLKGPRPELKTAVLFWQNSMYINSDIVITPRPLHLDSGLVQWCYSKPAGYYEKLKSRIGDFKLPTYWGPIASLASSRWIANAALETWGKHKPNLLLVYLPHLDYASQKFGPDSTQVHEALREIDGVVGELLEEFSSQAAMIVCSEYSLAPVREAICPNRILRQAGLLHVREIVGKEYLDFELSDAFAMADHQVAHIFCKPQAIQAARHALASAHPLDWAIIDHPRAGELIAVAPPDKWFAYYWWMDWNKAPEFARFVDIHRKPGYDPCELWFDWRRMARTFKPATAVDPFLVKGSHGRVPAGDSDPNNWATLVVDEKIAEVAQLQDRVDATQLAPLVCRLLLG